MLLTFIDLASAGAAVLRLAFPPQEMIDFQATRVFDQVWVEEDKSRAPNLAYNAASIILPSGAADATGSQFPLHPTTWANAVVTERKKRTQTSYGNNFSSFLSVLVLCRAPEILTVEHSLIFQWIKSTWWAVSLRSYLNKHVNKCIFSKRQGLILYFNAHVLVNKQYSRLTASIKKTLHRIVSFTTYYITLTICPITEWTWGVGLT